MQGAIETATRTYVELTEEQIRAYLLDILARQFPEPGKRQVPFNPVETLLCYGLFYILDPHRYGGGNIDTVPKEVKQLAFFFRRSPGSITSKMLNMDGSRTHAAKAETDLFALFSMQPGLYPVLYRNIMTVARNLSIDENSLPDFLGNLFHQTAMQTGQEELLGQEDLPASVGELLSNYERQMQELEQAFGLKELVTEKFVERKVRLAQHRFAREVLANCLYTCVFCGFAPHSLPMPHGLLRASHIKPWARSNNQEKVDVRNGLAACPMHDAAFDRGFLTITSSYQIQQSHLIQHSLTDPEMTRYFGQALSSELRLPPQAHKPTTRYLHYHQQHIFRG